MGDDIPPGEINHITGPGQHFGFPWFGGGSVRTNEYKDTEPPADAVPPVVEYIAHAADLGMMFYTGSKFPAKYKSGIFPAQHGSWNRTVPVGARVMFTPINEDGTAGRAGGVRRGLAYRRANISGGRSTWRSCLTARSSSPTISPERSIASRTASD